MRRSRKPDAFAQCVQQFVLRCRFGELARQSFARIGERVIDKLPFLPALGRIHFNLVTALDRQRGGEQRFFCNHV